MPRLMQDFVFRAHDADGDPVGGAEIFAYLAGTTTSATIYSDPEMTTAHASPVVADGGGVFPPIYVPVGFYKLDMRAASTLDGLSNIIVGARLPGYPVDNIAVGIEITSQPALEYATRADAMAATVASDTPSLRLLGYSAPGDGGGATYVTVASEPSHAGKIQTLDGTWRGLAEREVTPEMFGASGDGSSDDSAAFAAMFAFIAAMKAAFQVGATVRLRPVTYALASPIGGIIPDVGGGTSAGPIRIIVRGAGKGATRLLWTANMATPFIDASPDPTFKMGGVEFHDLTIDGGGNTGTCFYLSHISNKSLFSDLIVQGVRGVVFDCYELWDSDFYNVNTQDCGHEASELPVLRFSNRSASIHNSGCNNLGFYNLHCEESRYWSLDLNEHCRKFTFVRLKCHQEPGNFPSAGIGHVRIDAKNGAAVNENLGTLTFLGSHLAVSAGPAFKVENTGGAVGEGVQNLQIIGGSVQAQAHHAVEVVAAAGGIFMGVYTTGGTLSPFNIAPGAQFRVDLPSCQITESDDAQRTILHGSDGTSLNIVSGVLPFPPAPYLTVEGEGGAADTLDAIGPGVHGQIVTLSMGHNLTIRDSAVSGVSVDGAIRCGDGRTRFVSAASGRSSVSFRYDQHIKRWLFVGALDAGLFASKTHDWASLATGSSQTTTLTVTGAALGMQARPWMSADLGGSTLHAYVSGANTVTVVQSNLSGSAVDVASGTLYAEVLA